MAQHFLDQTGLARFLARLKEIFVRTVNGVAPDEDGSVMLSAGDVGAASTEEVEGKANLAEITTLTERIATNETKYNNMSAAVTEVKTEQGQLNTEVTKLTGGMSQAQEDITALDDRVDVLEEKAEETYKDVLTVTDESTVLTNRGKTGSILFGAGKTVVASGSGSLNITEDGVSTESLAVNEVTLGNLKFSVGANANTVKGQWV